MHAALNVRATQLLPAALATAALLALSCAAAHADGATPAPSPKPTASPTPSASPAPNPLGKIVVRGNTREGYSVPIIELQRLGAKSVADALRYVPGAFVQQYGTTGTLQTVALRGASSEQTLVLLDGRPVNEGDTGVTDFSSIPLNSIQAITVIEGGLSARYGSGAVGGVVLLTSKYPGRDQTSAFAQIGYQGAFEGGVGASAGDFPRGGLHVDALTRSELNTFDYPSFNGIAGGTRSNNDVRASDVTACVCYGFGHLGAALHLEDNTSDVGAPGSTEFGSAFVSAFARQQRDVNRSALNLDFAGGSDALTQVEVFADGRRVHFYDPTPAFPYDTLTEATARGYKLTQSVRLSRGDVLLVGYQGRADRALFQGTIDAPPQVVAASSTTYLYANDTYDSPDGGFEAVAGLRTDDTQGTQATTVPSFSLKKSVGGSSADEGTSLRGSYERSFRVPNLDELYFPGFGNPHLQPEYAATFDIGMFTGNNRFQGSATLFGSDTNNLIVNQAIDTMGDFLPFNVGRARVRGYSLHISNAQNVRVGAQASYTGFPVARDESTVPDINGVVTNGNRLLYRPTSTGSFEIWRKSGPTPDAGQATGDDGLDLLYVGSRYGDEENTHFLPAYVTVGAHISRLVSKHLTVTLRLNNLTGQRVEEAYGYPVLGTTFSVRLTAH